MVIAKQINAGVINRAVASGSRGTLELQSLSEYQRRSVEEGGNGGEGETPKTLVQSRTLASSSACVVTGDSRDSRIGGDVDS